MLILVVSLAFLHCITAQNTTTQNSGNRVFAPLKQSDYLKAKAMLRWLINNRTENNTRLFNAGFIRLSFHDCVGGCDGCLNLRNPGNTGQYSVPPLNTCITCHSESHDMLKILFTFYQRIRSSQGANLRQIFF